ncbi:hypothetical protein [Paraflavitalea speifideaquila]|uniref:hypothetical protein n=1 Tax=Paraflavitalea speifideaquila TaxID=3076558 RepID=UPI0028ED377C|nr:hypothetical protein [Paraflavitalea speifideiaquila]
MRGWFYASFAIFVKTTNTMRSLETGKRVGVMFLLLVLWSITNAQSIRGKGDSWQEVFNNKRVLLLLYGIILSRLSM